MQDAPAIWHRECQQIDTPVISPDHECMSAKATYQEGRVDGRHAWRERNRAAVVDALLDLYMEGAVNPGAQEIAERSGVSRRSLFRYFDDMDDMCRVAIGRHWERVSHLFELEGVGEGTLEERITRIVGQRVRLYEAIAPVRRIARSRALSQPIIAKELDRVRSRDRRQLKGHFAPELEKLGSDERRAVLATADALTSFESFELMRDVHGLGTREIEDALRHALASLLDSC